MSAVLEAAERFRHELVAGDLQAIRTMTRVYAATWARLQDQLDRLTKQLEDALEAGMVAVARVPGSGAALGEGEFSINWLSRQARYRALISQCQQEMAVLAQRVPELIEEHQRMLRDMGIRHATGLLDASMKPVPPALRRLGIRLTWNRVPAEALENLIGFLSDGSPVAEKFRNLPEETVAGIREEFETGFAQGIGPRQIASRIRRRFESKLTNALVTCRTEALRAYRTAAHENYRANSDIVKGWIWQCAESARTCSACWGMHGSRHTLDEELVDHPAGRCCAIPITRTWAELFPGRDLGAYTETSTRGWEPESRFKQLSEREQRRILGPTRFERWKAGELKLRDIPKRVSSPVWGDSYRPKTLTELGLQTDSSSE